MRFDAISAVHRFPRFSMGNHSLRTEPLSDHLTFKMCTSNSIVLVVIAIGMLSTLIIRQLKKKTISSFPDMQDSESTAKPERPITEAELSKATGENGEPIYVAVKDPFSTKVTIFDVTSGKDFYGAGGPYHVFAGTNATHGLAISSTDPDKVAGDLSSLTQSQKDTHMQWHAKYSTKYPIVGYLVLDGVSGDGETDSIITQDAESKKDA